MTVAAAHRLRRSVAGLTALAQRDLRALWRDVDTAVRARAALEDVLPALVETYGSAAATVAADWYDDLREQQQIDGRFRAIVAELGDPGTSALAGWATAEATSPETVLTLAGGGMQRRITNAARDTVAGSAALDPGAEGWQRVTRADGCAFCQMLAGRAVLYRSESTADFGAHDDCNCTVTPAWGGRERPVKPHTPSARNISDADRARAREWMRAHL